MPQHLCFTVNGEFQAILTTGNLSGRGFATGYSVQWCFVDNTGTHVGDFDTGIISQPTNQAERRADFLCDFTHARRAIAAARVSAVSILETFPAEFKHDGNAFEQVCIYLRTNSFDRGSITISHETEQTYRICTQIGTGPNRPAGALPSTTSTYEYTESTPERLSPIGIALKLLASNENRLLQFIEQQIEETK
jgi:hypothetical protein